MNIVLQKIIVNNRRSKEELEFSNSVTFLYGPVSTGKSTIARLIDYCFGGELERTPAIRQEFVSVELFVKLGDSDCVIERGANDTQYVRVTWSPPRETGQSLNVPLVAQEVPLLNDEVYNYSDLIFYLCGVTPIKVRKKSRDLESPLVRLSIRDILWYCYLEQTYLDSSFFRLEDPFRSPKSKYAMRFFTGLHSERLNQLESELWSTTYEQKAKREAVNQIRLFMSRFDFGSEVEIDSLTHTTTIKLKEAQSKRFDLEQNRFSNTHPVDDLRTKLRYLSNEIEKVCQAINDSGTALEMQKALRAELITTKTKSLRNYQAGRFLEGIRCQSCPDCGADLSQRTLNEEHCSLCGTSHSENRYINSIESETLRIDLNERIDQINDSIMRREHELTRMNKNLNTMKNQKIVLDNELQETLAKYDSSFIASIRGVDQDIATLKERISFLNKIHQMPQAVNKLEEEAGALQGKIDALRSSLIEEKKRLIGADNIIASIADEFKRIMLSVSFPGVSRDDNVSIDPRNWNPTIIHGEQEWTYWDTGSGGKKTLFNVCYALAIHSVALDYDIPIPNFLIIDSPTKNISEDENPDLVNSLYTEIYRIASKRGSQKLQFLLIDSDIVRPTIELSEFIERKMAGTTENPSLISYYVGP
jgi:uncharacterized protein YdcH (DUF465 family)